MKILNFLKNVLQNGLNAIRIQMGVFTGEGIIERIGSRLRGSTVAFKYPRNGRYYIALNHHSFGDYVCGWIGCVHDCYILQSASLNTPFNPFEDRTSLDIVESHNELAPAQTMTSVAMDHLESAVETVMEGIIVEDPHELDGYDERNEAES